MDFLRHFPDRYGYTDALGKLRGLGRKVLLRQFRGRWKGWLIALCQKRADRLRQVLEQAAVERGNAVFSPLSRQEGGEGAADELKGLGAAAALIGGPGVLEIVSALEEQRVAGRLGAQGAGGVQQPSVRAEDLLPQLREGGAELLGQELEKVQPHAGLQIPDGLHDLLHVVGGVEHAVRNVGQRDGKRVGAGIAAEIAVLAGLKHRVVQRAQVLGVAGRQKGLKAGPVQRDGEVEQVALALKRAEDEEHPLLDGPPVQLRDPDQGGDGVELIGQPRAQLRVRAEDRIGRDLLRVLLRQQGAPRDQLG